jgi:hypothetical protein
MGAGQALVYAAIDLDSMASNIHGKGHSDFYSLSFFIGGVTQVRIADNCRFEIKNSSFSGK